MTSLPAPRTVTTAAATGSAYDHGAHVVAWTPSGQAPVLWLSPRTELEEGSAIRGGVPVCFPWFGPGRSGDRKPAHGFARTSTWRCVEEAEGRLVFELTEQDATLEGGWTQPFAARLAADFGERLEVCLAVTNTGDEPLEIEAALHTYLSVGDVRQVAVLGLDGVRYVDKADGGSGKTQDGDITFIGETDRVYDSVADVELVDPVLHRTLTVSSEGATKTVVWNPGEGKAATMKDVAAWDTFCCIEAANALDGFVTIAPGETHALTQRVAVA